MPGRSSMPDATSTPYGRTVRIASADVGGRQPAGEQHPPRGGDARRARPSRSCGRCRRGARGRARRARRAIVAGTTGADAVAIEPARRSRARTIGRRQGAASSAVHLRRANRRRRARARTSSAVGRTNTPTGRTGRAAARRARDSARDVDTRAGCPGHSTKPTASTPSSHGERTSSSRVMPQNLMQVMRARGRPPTCRQQLAQRRPGSGAVMKRSPMRNAR